MVYDNHIAVKYPNIIRVAIMLTHDGALYVITECASTPDSGVPASGSFLQTSVYDFV